MLTIMQIDVFITLRIFKNSFQELSTYFIMANSQKKKSLNRLQNNQVIGMQRKATVWSVLSSWQKTAPDSIHQPKGWLKGQLPMLVDELTVIKTSKQEEELTQNLLQQYTASSSAHNSPLSWKHDECPLQLESKFSPTNRCLAGAGRWLTRGSLPPKLTEMIVFVRLAERVRLLFSWMSNLGLSSLIKSAH